MSNLPATPLPFDPALAGDDGVLSIEWQLSDHQLETQDTTKLHVSLTNRSSYFEADELEIWIRIKAPDGSEPGERPDGCALLAIWPAAQSVRTIAPQTTQSFDYFIVARGPRAGLYTMAVEVNYKLVYVYRELCRQTTAIANLPLHIQGGSGLPLPGPLLPLPPSSEPHLERISTPQRRLHMSGHIEQDGEYGHSRRRELHAIERRVILPGGGEVIVSYRLVKGSHTRPDESCGSFGYNPASKAIESYFSTSDEAAMEITMRNQSNLHLKHVNLTDVQLFYANDDGSADEPADQEQLPDGNLLFEVLPSEAYFGHLVPGESRTRHLGLVTRGVQAGRFLVRFEVRYEIVDGVACVHLPLIVNPD